MGTVLQARNVRFANVGSPFVNDIREIARRLERFGEVHRGWIGVRIQDISPEMAEQLNLGRTRGVLIASVDGKRPPRKQD